MIYKSPARHGRNGDQFAAPAGQHGKFSKSEPGRIRRDERHAAIAAKRMFLNS